MGRVQRYGEEGWIRRLLGQPDIGLLSPRDPHDMKKKTDFVHFSILGKIFWQEANFWNGVLALEYTELVVHGCVQAHR